MKGFFSHRLSTLLCIAVLPLAAGCLKKDGGGLLGVGDAGDGSVTQINPPTPPPPHPIIKHHETDSQGGRLRQTNTPNYGVSKTSIGGDVGKTQATSANFVVTGGISAAF